MRGGVGDCFSSVGVGMEPLREDEDGVSWLVEGDSCERRSHGREVVGGVIRQNESVEPLKSYCEQQGAYEITRPNE